MKSRASLVDKRAKVLSLLKDYPNALSGNLSIVSIPSGSKNCYGRLTWKEMKKTKILYVRKEEITQVRKAVTAFADLKTKVLELGDINRDILLQKRRDS